MEPVDWFILSFKNYVTIIIDAQMLRVTQKKCGNANYKLLKVEINFKKKI